MTTALHPELLYRNGQFLREPLRIDESTGRVPHPTQSVGWANPIARSASSDLPPESETEVDFHGKALLPGFINAHSHSFQRLIRGKAESRAISGRDFWSWRNTMYHAAAQLTPDGVYDVARMCFLEMLHTGITTVGEFHYLHTAPDGTPYDDPNLLSKQVIAAAQSVGIRIVLLNSAYMRAGFELAADPGQRRFYETCEHYLANTLDLIKTCAGQTGVHIGVAPHSIRAVPLDALHAIVELARSHKLPLHMHVAEQLAENRACEQEYGTTPVAFLSCEGLLQEKFVAVHAIHLSADEVRILADTRAIVCSCPTTERNLGDGIVPADLLMRLGVRHALGTDSQAQIAPLEDARQLDYHLRLAQQQRAILDGIAETSLAQRLFDCATTHGAAALGIAAGTLQPDAYADCITVDLDDLSIAGDGADDLLPRIVFGLERTAVRDVFVNGRPVLKDGHHPLEEEIVAKYRELYRSVWESRT